jgi:hypothetical protein
LGGRGFRQQGPPFRPQAVSRIFLLPRWADVRFTFRFPSCRGKDLACFGSSPPRGKERPPTTRSTSTTQTRCAPTPSRGRRRSSLRERPSSCTCVSSLCLSSILRRDSQADPRSLIVCFSRCLARITSSTYRESTSFRRRRPSISRSARSFIPFACSSADVRLYFRIL